MDNRLVRVLRNHPGVQDEKPTIYVDEGARLALGVEWETEVAAIGRKKLKVIIKPLGFEDSDAQIARTSEEVRDLLEVEIGEEILIARE